VPADVILLNGASSAGKSSLARAIQDRMRDTWLTLGIDTMITAMPRRLDGSPEGLLFHPDGRIDTGPAWHALESAWRRGVGAMARSGLKLVIDEVTLGGAAGQAEWKAALAGTHVLWVAVKCDAAVLAAREAARGDRVIGQAARQAGFVHDGIAYDLEVDTSHRSSADCAAEIVARASR
jgi:chloramphenicol 3-O phosphotransferase